MMTEISDDSLITMYEIVGNPKLGIKALIPVSKSTWIAGCKSGLYPPPVRIAKRRVAWKGKHIKQVMSGEWVPPGAA